MLKLWGVRFYFETQGDYAREAWGHLLNFSFIVSETKRDCRQEVLGLVW